MSEGLSLDFGSALPYLEDRIRAWLGHDPESVRARELLAKTTRIASREAATVQIIGMDRPIPLEHIYQPSGLRRPRDVAGQPGDLAALLATRKNAIVLGGPGTGKTILLHHAFTSLSRTEDRIPLLFTLRWPDAVEDLRELVRHFEAKTLKKPKNADVILLVDGYDEITPEQRKRVAQALREFSATEVGTFVITCRKFYDVDELKAAHYELAPFTAVDAERYVSAFSKAYDVQLDSRSLLNELSARGFSDFREHPLLLALVCILKSGPMPAIPRSPIDLIRRALETLTFRWDYTRDVQRTSLIDLDGESRVRCLLAIAYDARELVVSEWDIRSSIDNFLRLSQRPHIAADLLLREIAQWYGVIVPVLHAEWTFVHRTIHDYLAARYWVEMGKFSPSAVELWNTRAAYAACMTPDATRAMIRALAESDDISFVATCLDSGARFDPADVADHVISHFERRHSFRTSRTEKVLVASTTKDIFSLASSTFVQELIRSALSQRSEAAIAVLLYSLYELYLRRIPLPADVKERACQRMGAVVEIGVKRSDGAHHVSVEALFCAGA